MNERYPALDLNNKLIWNLRDIGHTMRHMFEGRGSQKRVLMILREVSTITQRDLTQRLGVQPGSASEVVGKLETAGLLRRVPTQADRRTADICLTQAGKKAADAAYVQREERHQKMFACLSEEEKRTLLELLEKINADWDREYRAQAAADDRKGHGNCHGR